MTNFTEFTKRSKITKTIGFELKPVQRTKEFQELFNDFEMDAQVSENVIAMMPIIDKCVIEIMSKALENIDFDFKSFDPECSKDELEKVYSELTKNVTPIFNEMMHRAYSENNADYGINSMESAAFVQGVLSMYTDNTDLIQSFKGSNDRLSSLLVSRINALTINMPKRVLENLEKYKKNIKTLTKLVNSEISKEIYDEYPKIDKLLDVENYKDYITPVGIDEYNAIMNGITTEDIIIKKGLIQLVNENNLTNKTKLPLPEELFKQILFPKTKAFTIEKIISDKEAFDLIKNTSEQIINAGNELVSRFKELNATDIVVRYRNLGSLSHEILGDHSILTNIVKNDKLSELKEELNNAATSVKRKKILKEIDAKEKQFKKEQYSLTYILRLYEEIDSATDLLNMIKSIAGIKFLEARTLLENVIEDINNGTITKLKNTETEKDRIKEMFDTWINFRKFMLLFIRNDSEMGNNIFYNDYFTLMGTILIMNKNETKILGYITRTPADMAKIEVSLSRYKRRPFMKSLQSEDGSDNKYAKFKTDTFAYYKKDGKYYFIQATPEIKPVNIFGTGKGRIATQKKFGNPITQLPKLVFSKKAKEAFDNGSDEYTTTEGMSSPFTITRAEYEIYKNKTYTITALKKKTVTEKEYKKNLLTLLTLYKTFMDTYIKCSPYKDKIEYKPLEEYKDSGEFFEDIGRNAQTKAWEAANDELIERLVNEGKIYMFLISSKGFDYKKTANEDIFIEALENNMSDVELLVEPKIYYRKAVIPQKVTHEKNSILVNKRDIEGYRIPDAIYKELSAYYGNLSMKTDLSEDARMYIETGRVCSKKSDRDLIKDKRYTEDKQLIRITYSKNTSCGKAKKSASAIVNETKDTMNILSITRSMNDLIYITVTTPDGEILESKSLNCIDKDDWSKKLKDISNDRRESKSKEWDYTKKCKDPRDAYIAKAVSVIVRMIIEYNALVVCEKISDEVKDKFSAFDDQIFKKFEKVLRSRLADLHFRNIPLGEPGSVTNPYQFCDDNDNEFQDGIMFFVTTPYTFGVDPETGFANVFELKNINTRFDKQNFLSKFDSITYDENKNRFVFKFNYDNFATKKDIKKTEWTVLAGGPTTRYNREYGYNTYIEETASELYQKLQKSGHTGDLAKLAFDARLLAGETEELYDIFIRAIKGYVNAHDDIRKQYISPVTGKVYDNAELGTLMLAKKFKWTQKEKKERGEWIDNIKG